MMVLNPAPINPKGAQDHNQQHHGRKNFKEDHIRQRAHAFVSSVAAPR